MGYSCKPKAQGPTVVSQNTQDSNIKNVPRVNNSGDINSRGSRRGQARVEWPTGVYLVASDASEEELENILSVEFDNKDNQQNQEQLGLTKLFGFSFKRKPVNFADSLGKVKKTKIPAKKKPLPVKIRAGDFSIETSVVRAPVEITKVVSSNGRTIPVRVVDTFDDIPIGSGEYAYVTLTKKQYVTLNSRTTNSAITEKTVHSVVRDTYDGSGVILKVEDNRIFATKNSLDSENPVMFTLENNAHTRAWDSVKQDLSKAVDEIEATLSSARFLGEGTFGKAYLINKPNGTQYALKKMSAEDEANLREISLITDGSCKDCLQYYGAVKKGDEYYLASEVASGGELADRVARKPLSNNEIVQLLTQGKQLADKGLINKDIKLENVLVTQSGQVKIMDHGLAQRNPTWVTDEGSGHTIAPEVARQQVIPHGLADRVHTYSIAMSIIDGRSRKIVDENIKKIAQNNRSGSKSNIEYVTTPPFTKSEKRILELMLEPDITKRISIDDALDRWKALPPTRN